MHSLLVKQLNSLALHSCSVPSLALKADHSRRNPSSSPSFTFTALLEFPSVCHHSVRALCEEVDSNPEFTELEIFPQNCPRIRPGERSSFESRSRRCGSI